MKKLTISSSKLILILTIYFSTVLNMSFWRYIYNNLDITNFRVACFAFSIFFLIAIPLFVLFNLTIIKKFAKPFIVFLLLLSSFTNFMMFKYGVYINSDMIQTVMETNVKEATDLITVSLVLWVFITGVIPSVLLIITKIQYKPLKIEFKKRCKYVIICLLFASVTGVLLYKEYISFGRNNHKIMKLINVCNYTSGTIKYIRKLQLAKREFVELDKNPQYVGYHKDNKQLYTVVIFIIGETARASSFSLNGYERKTNPLLEKQNIAYFKNIHSCGTLTAVSVPCMFSNMNRSDFDSIDANFTENFLDLAQKSGYQIIWKENDGGCKSVCNRVNYISMTDVNNPQYCHDGYCYDESLLDDLDDILANIKQNTLIVLHTQGSHGPTYYQRYPDKFKKFVPTCDTADIQNCSLNQIINTYDNTILYTDFIISSTIDMMKKFPQYEASVIYVSDHGESLGENNIYLHGMPYKIAPIDQIHVPMLVWMNENMKKWDYINYDCLKEIADKNAYSHDNIFHSLLGLLKIKTSVYDGNYDLFKECRMKALPSAL